MVVCILTAIRNKTNRIVMKKMMTTKYFRRRKAILAKKLQTVSKDLHKLSHHIKGL